MENRPFLDRVAQALLEREVLEAEEVKMLMEGLPLKAREPVSEEMVPEKSEPKEKEKERKPALTPPILQNPGSVTQS